jgi:hypothetical protein
MRRRRKGKRVQQTQTFLTDRTTLDGLALRGRELHPGAAGGYGTKYDTNLGTWPECGIALATHLHVS